MPTFDDTYFVIKSKSSTAFPNGERENNDFGFEPGYRFGAEYALCDNGRKLQAYYTHLDACQKEVIYGADLWATLSGAAVSLGFADYAGSATSTLNCMWQKLDANFSQKVLTACGIVFFIEPGIEYAYLRLDENYFYENPTETAVIDLKSKAWGVGPEIGLGLDYNFYEGKLTCNSTHAFSVDALFSGSILMGTTQTNTLQIAAGDTLIHVKDESTWRTIPALHARAGLNYLIRGTWASLSLGIGYEFNTYVRAVARSVFNNVILIGEELGSPGVNNNSCSTTYYDFDVQGLYVMGGISF